MIPTVTAPVYKSARGNNAATAAAGQIILDDAGNSVNAPRTYETVAASQTDQVMGGTGAIGDVLDHILVVPLTTAAGTVSIKDGSGSGVTVFTGGGTLGDLKPFPISFGRYGLTSTSGAWKITTGANVTAIGIGKFT